VFLFLLVIQKMIGEPGEDFKKEKEKTERVRFSFQPSSAPRFKNATTRLFFPPFFILPPFSN